MKRLAYLLMAASSVAFANPPPITGTVSPALDSTCSSLGEIAYWAATAHLAKSDERRLSEARAEALKANKLRPAVPSNLIGAANLAGVMSHGNAGPGLSSLEAARADGVSIAMDVYRRCLEGKLADKEPTSSWTRVGHTVEAVMLYDKQTVRRTGLGTTVWTLTNFKVTEVIEGKSHRSAKTQFEFDCKAERYRLLATIYYAGADGSGRVNASESDVGVWTPVAPKTLARSLMAIVCER